MAKRPATTRKIPRRKGPKPQNRTGYVRLADALADWRRAKGLKQIELAQRLGKTQSFVTKYETRKRRLDFLEVVAILDILGVDLEQAAKFARSR